MRNASAWYGKVAGKLDPVWPDDLSMIRPSLVCQVELGFRLLERLTGTPSETGHFDGADGVYALLGGYPFSRALGLDDGTQQHLIVNARYLLWQLRRRRTWQQCLEAYHRVPARLRAYELTTDMRGMKSNPPTIAADRIETYDQALMAVPPFRRENLPLAPAGTSRFRDRGRTTSVTIPPELILAAPTGHDLTRVPASTAGPLYIPLDGLADTAQWMDESEADLDLRRGNWSQRLIELDLEVLASDGRSYVPSRMLTLDRLTHLVGMVGAGKSTLMILIAVWAARQRPALRTTVIVGDVAEQLTLTTLFRNLGLDAAPVLGGTTRERHAGRLHRRLASKGLHSLLEHADPGFDDLSSACALDALRGIEAAEPLRYADAPCISLKPVKANKGDGESLLPQAYPSQDYRDRRPATPDDEDDTPPHGCPMWSRCPRHSIDRDLVDAQIWVANPASLLQSAVPQHLNPERLRRLELACLRSDIVIVDEADRVQMQLDTAFAPSATLVTRGPESWLDRLHTHKIDVLARKGRIPLSDNDVETWAKAFDVVSAATNHIYAMLINHDDLRKWADTDYFSAWTLQDKLIGEWYPELGGRDGRRPTSTDRDLYDGGNSVDPLEDLTIPLPEPTDPWAARRSEVMAIMDAFRDDPLGDRALPDPSTASLMRLANDLLHTLNAQVTRRRVRELLGSLLKGSPLEDGTIKQPPPPAGAPARDQADIWGSDAWYDRTALRLEFSLLLAALHHRLTRVTFLWPQVEAALRLDATDNELSRRPPLDYAPVIPEAPMGNVLGFQYLPDDPEPGPEQLRSGTLRFFRCAGIGRELLLNLTKLGADPANGRPGPHALLMSGTSWAGTSTRSHILTPVTAVLKPHEDALKAIRGTSFRVQFLYDGRTPLTLSGTKPDLRHVVLRQMISKLAKPGLGQPSPLEQELRQIPDIDRQRALLLVGSYAEANIAADLLEEIPRWRGKVRVLAGDDAELEYLGDTATSKDGLTHAAVIRRGDLASFAEDPQAQLLVAPLMAIERGHNILNGQRKAAFGTVLFLARPHPRPDDISLAIFAINDWAARFTRDWAGLPTGTFTDLATQAGRLDAAALAFRHLARGEWRRLLSRRYAYSQLNPLEKKSFAWDQLVVIWQVIGRLVRGGVAARVVFVDAAFAPALAAQGPASAGTSPAGRRQDSGLLIKLHDVLAPYFDPDASPEAFAQPADPALVKILYQPLFDALQNLRSTAFAPLLGHPLEGTSDGQAI